MGNAVQVPTDATPADTHQPPGQPIEPEKSGKGQGHAGGEHVD